MALDATKNKKTDPEGAVDQQSETQAHLSNFDIDGAEVGVDGARLKPSHIAFLNSLLARIKATPGQKFVVGIGGFTDTLNSSGQFDNQALSARRAAAVERFMKARLPAGAIVNFNQKAFGPVGTLAANTPDDFSRAVDVALLAPGDPQPRRPGGPSGGPAGPRSVPRADGRGGFAFGCTREFELPRSVSFQIRIMKLTVITVSVGVKAVSIDFQIVDTTNRLGVEYSLSGVNAIISADLDLVSISEKAPFTTFQTGVPTRVTDFQSLTLKTGLAVSVGNLLGPLPKPIVDLTFKDAEGVGRLARAPINMRDKEGTASRIIKGSLTMDSVCRGSRGALEIDRTNDFN